MKTRKTTSTAKAQPKVEPAAEARNVYFLQTKTDDRYQRMTAAEAAKKNEARKNMHLVGQWEKVEDKTDLVGVEVYDKEKLVVGQARKDAYKAGRDKDFAEDEARAARRKAREAEKAEAQVEKKSEKTGKSGGAARITWHEVGMCDFLRYCGAKKIDKARATELAQKAGFSPSPTTVYIQMKKGADGENVPTIAAEHLAEIGFEAPAKKAKKAGKAKKN